VARNKSVASSGSPCLEARVAALMTAAGLAEARLVRADLRRFPLHELDPDPGEACVPVDDKPNPFNAAPMADRYLRGLRSSRDVVHLDIPGEGSWEQHVGYITARTFRVMSQAGADALPGLAVFGKGDGLDDGRRAEKINAYVREKRSFAAIDPIDPIHSFLAIDGEDRYASVAIVARSLQHVAIAVATGPTIAVGTHHTALVRHDSGDWMPACDLPAMPVLPASVSAQISAPDRSGIPWPPRSRAAHTGTIFPESGNPILLNGLVLGGLEAGYQPDCRPWDCAAMYIAAAAGRTVVRAATGKLLTQQQVQSLLIHALLKGEKVPGLIAARHELAAHRLRAFLRQCGIA
jgi:hypothetical protein